MIEEIKNIYLVCKNKYSRQEADPIDKDGFFGIIF